MAYTSESIYKGMKSIVLERGRIRAEYIEAGARMVSFVDKKSGREIMLQSKLNEFKKREFDCFYPGCDPAGFDDMFPTIDACYYEEFPWKGIKIADHGEVWSLDWEFNLDIDTVEMSVYGVRFPYRLIKKVYCKDDTTLRIDYRVENMSTFDMQFLWTAHPMMQVDEGTRIILPPECRTGYTIVSSCGRLDSSCGSFGSSCGRLGGYGNVFELEERLNAERNENLVVTVRSPEENNAEKYYIREKLSNGRCKMEFPIDRSSLEFRFPVETVPYLAVLVTEGYQGDPNLVIIEPATALYDRVDFAKAYGAASILKGNGCYEWYLEMELGDW